MHTHARTRWFLDFSFGGKLEEIRSAAEGHVSFKDGCTTLQHMDPCVHACTKAGADTFIQLAFSAVEQDVKRNRKQRFFLSHATEGSHATGN